LKTLTLSDLQLQPGLIAQPQNITLPSDVVKILDMYNVPSFVRILAYIALQVPGINVWRLIRSARLEENHGCPIVTTADIVSVLRTARGESSSAESESETDEEYDRLPSVSTAMLDN
jgi:hypothetical protein